MTRPNIEAALERAERATPELTALLSSTPSAGPAEVYSHGALVARLPVRLTPGGTFLHNRDAAFFAAARTDLPEIARYALELEETIAEVHEREQTTMAGPCPCDTCTAVRARTP